MRNPARYLLDLFRTWRGWLPRYAIGGAWLFMISSAFALLWLAWEGQGADGHSRVFGVEAGGIIHTVWGLTYSGFLGSALLYSELIALIAAIAVTSLPDRFVRAGGVIIKAQKAAHSYLTGWAGLWMIGAMHLATVAPGFWTLQSIFLAALFGCTLYRAIRDWPRQRRDLDEEVKIVAENPPSDVVPAIHGAGPIRHRSAFNEIEEVSQFMIGRDDVKFSSKMTQIFRSGAGDPDSSQDTYGMAVRKAMSDGVRCMRSLATRGWSAVRSAAGALRSQQSQHTQQT